MQRIVQYLVASFEAANPESVGHSITAAELLERAVAKLDENFPNDPGHQRPVPGHDRPGVHGHGTPEAGDHATGAIAEAAGIIRAG
jgi:hypothetical protein